MYVSGLDEEAENDDEDWKTRAKTNQGKIGQGQIKYFVSNAPAEKTPDGFAGRDKDGRIWRKAGPNKQILYLISSLKNKPK